LTAINARQPFVLQIINNGCVPGAPTKQENTMAKEKRAVSTAKQTFKRGKTTTRGKPVAATRKGPRAKTGSDKRAIKARAMSRSTKKPASKRSRPPNQRPGNVMPDTVIVETIEERFPDVVIVTEVETMRLGSGDAIAELIQEDDGPEILEFETEQQ